jgi:magnesium-transporting ATPase (P-type)
MKNGDDLQMIDSKNNKDEVTAKKLYGKPCTLSKEEFIKEYSINTNGLTSDQVREQIQKYGFNEISSTKPKKWYHYFLGSLFSPFNCILLGIVAVLLYTDVYLPETPSYANIIVIIRIVNV